ncbi:PEP/pyruvate-binding domain-containing protein [Chelativorans salis]|uniref:PEP-utilizing enzyme n=1 Tax=Chelativorans salis TaxID=2978478 RepID=A0ABT2LGM2_9HYPH|nr:PEP/pyruvate-binding domain-containing protein [Chelativorans sp. EGI FJ00035]MCT7373660.1 PEP-utilizing enzyme [Chelativorans sp. EGI FJ00035]
MIVNGSAAAEAAKIGGKAATLAALVKDGFEVPPFFTITPAAFTGTGLRAEARKGLIGHLEEIGPGPFAVRSSAREEDGAEHSHAGQFLSLLNIAAADVPKAAHRVWKSGGTDTLRAYRARRGLGSGDHAPAVLVQRLVRARAAGVAFSADPVSGRRDRIVASAVAGLGDRLVGGETDGDDYLIDRRTGALLEGPEDGVLSPADLEALSAMVARIEAVRGVPQDVEWAFEGKRLFLLQARPITTPLRAEPIDDPQLTIFDNSNIIESYPGLVSPLTYSFAQYVYARVYPVLMKLLGVRADVIRAQTTAFENLLGRIDCRVYYNLINWYRLIALLPCFAINRAPMETMMGVSEPLPVEIADRLAPKPAKGWAAVREYARISRTGLGLIREAIRLPRTIRAFHERLDRALEVKPAEIDAMPLTALAAEYRRVESQLLGRWDAPLINDLLCMMAFGASRKLMERWAGEVGLALHNEVMIGQGDIISAEPARRIARMGTFAAGEEGLIEALEAGDFAVLSQHPKLEREATDYIAKFGDRCTQELKLESITLEEDPRPLLAAIAAAARGGRKPVHHAEREKDPAATLFAGRPVRRFIARRVLAMAKARVRDRENLRFERTRVFGHARRLFLAMGRQLHAHGVLEEARDVFYLTVPEVLGAIEGFGTSTDLAPLAAARKVEMARAEKRPDPPERLTVTGAAINAADLPSPSARSGDDGEQVRLGTACCAGIVQAPVRVVRDPRTESVKQGEVLVARFTDPGWIALFANASAIVVERGSLLSHSAIVARELGLPCVVGLRGATEWLVSGERVEVDGATGAVRKLNV